LGRVHEGSVELEQAVRRPGERWDGNGADWECDGTFRSQHSRSNSNAHSTN
jgi:hypothetical protein